MNKAFLILIFTLLPYLVHAQEGIVQGRLIESSGNPLPGVTIQIKGTQDAVVTDMDGNYSITCKVGDVLVFQMVGFSNQEKTVSLDMFKSFVETPVELSEKIVQAPVQIIRNKAYQNLVYQDNPDSGQFLNRNATKYKWRYKNCPTCNYIYWSESFKEIKDLDSIVEFVPLTEPVRYEISFSTFTGVKQVMHLPTLQSVYAQGRPFSGKETWFGAENNEPFAWGPEITNLAFDGSDYPYDTNGKLVNLDAVNSKPANVYDPYEVFKTGLNLKNSLKISISKDKNSVDISYTKTDDKGILEAMTLNSDMINFDSKIKKKGNLIKAGFKYFSIQNDFSDMNAMWSNLMASIMLTPPTFDNQQGYIFNGINQRSSAPAFKNNPYFLMNMNQNEKNNKYLDAYLSYKIDIDRTDLSLSADYNKDLCKELFHAQQATVGFLNSYQQDEKIESSALNFHFQANNNSLEDIGFHTSAIFNMEKLEFSRLIESMNKQDIQKNRNSLNWIQAIDYHTGNNQNFKLSLKNSVYSADDEQKWFQPTIITSYNFADWFFTNFIDYLSLSAGYALSSVELPLLLQDRGYSTLPYHLDQMNGFLENKELFYDESLDMETRQTWNAGIRTNLYLNTDFLKLIDFNLNYSSTIARNSIFPVQHSNPIELGNIGDIWSGSWDISLNLIFSNYNYLRWESKLIYSKSNSKVLGLHDGFDQIPIAGFQEVTKILKPGEPVGVIVGSAYQRNKKGQMLIGTDGYPLVSNDRQVIGDPNPDFYMSFENKLEIGRYINFSILLDYQKGGDIWNGTENSLSYFGLSANTVDERKITNYIFDGVTEDGQQNTKAVDFANPANGIDGNKWYRYGIGGVAEDAIEDGSWFRIKEIAVSITPLGRNHHFVHELSIKLYVQNLWISTKYKGASPLSWLNNYSAGQGLDYYNMPSIREFGIGIGMKI
jgi:hypothetical protein